MPSMFRRQLLASTLAWPFLPALAVQPRRLAFPRDHGSHNDTRTEWWYLTGQAEDESGRAFGFQVTFFRSRVDVAQTLPGRLAARQLLFAHAAITDVQAGRLRHDQRIARWNGALPAQRGHGVWASSTDLDIQLRDWRLRRQEDGAYAAHVQGDELGIDLTFAPRQALLLQGEAGFSRKGPSPAQASFYVSHPQLAVRGTLRLGGRLHAVQGSAWLDHEWSETLLHPEAVGWDWIGMNLDDGGSLTAFRLRRADGSSVWAGGSFRSATHANRVDAGQAFAPQDVHFAAQRHWTSPSTRARYPVQWSVDTPAGRYTVRALIDDQELDSRRSTGTVYWEGLTELLDSQGRRVGRGYLEMTGYAQALRL